MHHMKRDSILYGKKQHNSGRKNQNSGTEKNVLYPLNIQKQFCTEKIKKNVPKSACIKSLLLSLTDSYNRFAGMQSRNQ